MKINSPLDAMKLGMAYLPEDRKKDGIIADLSVRENIIIALQAKRGMFHPLSKKEMEEAADKYKEIRQGFRNMILGIEVKDNLLALEEQQENAEKAKNK